MAARNKFICLVWNITYEKIERTIGTKHITYVCKEYHILHLPISAHDLFTKNARPSKNSIFHLVYMHVWQLVTRFQNSPCTFVLGSLSEKKTSELSPTANRSHHSH